MIDFVVVSLDQQQNVLAAQSSELQAVSFKDLDQFSDIMEIVEYESVMLRASMVDVVSRSCGLEGRHCLLWWQLEDTLVDPSSVASRRAEGGLSGFVFTGQIVF